MRRLLIIAVAILGCSGAARAQRVTSVSLAAGASFSDVTRPTAAFAASAGVDFGISWFLTLQRSVAEFENGATPGTRRDVSLALLPVWEPLHGRVFAAAGAALNAQRIERIDEADVSRSRVGAVALAGIRIPLAGNGVVIELSGRADDQEVLTLSALFGVRVRFGVPNALKLGEPQSTAAAQARAAVWNDVLMQVVLLQQNLESFTRIKEIETGIELEFESGRVTLWDDVAKVARVLAAAEPPVIITAFGPNAGRVAAAVTAGSFPAERVKLQRDNRVYLRVER